MTNKKILDPCCGSRMFWYDRHNPDVLFADCRAEETTLCDGRTLRIEPDMIIDFRDMPFEDNTFDLVVFDPPHLIHAGEKYGGTQQGTAEIIIIIKEEIQQQK